MNITQNSCSYCVTLTDTFTPVVLTANYSVVEWYVFSSNNNNFVLLGTTTINTPFVYCTCGAGEYEFKAIYKEYDSTTCPPTVVYTGTDQSTFTVTEYKPQILNFTVDCCLTKDEVGTIVFETVDNGTVLPNNLTIVLKDPNGVVLSTTVTNSVPSYTFNFTPTVLGTYTIEITLSNTCEMVTKVYNIEICDSWKVISQNCNELVVSNLSSTVNMSVNLKFFDYTTLQFIDFPSPINDTISPSSNKIYVLNDGFYKATVDGVEYLVFVDCKISLCKKTLLTNLFCGCVKCDNKSLQKQRDMLNTYLTLEAELYAYWNKIRYQQSLTPLTINQELGNIFTYSKIIDRLSKICNDCGVSIDVKSSGYNSNTVDCGCKK